MNTSQPVSSAISGVEFGFLSPDDIRALSVKRITNPTTFDTLLHPVPGGLYDSALGVFADNPCSTCKLGFGCPGHCGHIELPLPVYHITFMDQCLRLLRAKCVYCHHLRIPQTKVNLYISKLRLITHGLLEQAEDIDQKISGDSKRKKATGARDSSNDEDEDEDANELIAKRDTYVNKTIKKAGIQKNSDWSMEKTEAVGDARRAVVKDLYTEMVLGKNCKNCKGQVVNPQYRKDKSVKIFRKPINSKDRANMINAGKRVENPILIMQKKQKIVTKSKANRVHADEGVADLSADSNEDEDEDEEMIDLEQDNETFIAEETMTAAPTRKGAVEYAKQEYMNPSEVLAAMRLLFEKEAELLGLVYSPQSHSYSPSISADMFFMHNILVPPNKYRPEAKAGGSIAENPKNSTYKNVLTASDLLRQINNELGGQDREGGYRKRDFNDLQDAWVSLQQAVNSIVDKDSNPLQGAAGKMNADGVKQTLEKKEGLFRKNMMGKRVNFAARSVISPDPNIETNEIGVPPVFARKLTYPEPVTNHNFYDLKEAVLNGPDKWPGAVAIENEFGQVINLKKKNIEERQALANQLLAPSNTSVNGAINKKVHRHLNNGDVVIMNRQPTLHKPSMMAHRARVLPGEKTIRMHYANCNTYNADFDGDEMNMHFPQNELARAEAATIADTDHQYLSATAGKPLRGLIQDHISMGVWLTNRDTFFNREDYQQLLYACLRPEDSHTTSGSLVTITPAIIKPRPMWTGKQVITTVLRNIKPTTHPGLTLTSKSQTKASLWGDKKHEEQDVIFHDGDLLCGILDKSQIGPSPGGFVNAIYEAYGHTVAGRLLSVLGRLLTKLLHMRAFSCGVEDLILTSEGEQKRREELKGVDSVGLKVAAKYVSLDADKINPNDPELRRRLEQVLRDSSKQDGLDVLTNGQTKDISSNVTTACLPDRLIKPFPKNQMQTMTGSGAKGSLVNANQISCNLGQQVLEGKRVPIMVSGKSLPCFKPFDSNVRAGGYITDRFLTGVRPQEYYFHAMAGREGLIDTAVKTSRSGYLQRCIVKGMEGLKVEYDTSVRDADGSMVQFLYGEDGLDTTKQKYLNDFKFQAENFWSLIQTLNMEEAFGKIQSEEATEWTKAAYKRYRKTGDLAAMDPAISRFSPTRHCGSTSEQFYAARKKYCDDNPDSLLKKKRKDPGDKVVRKNFEAALDVKYLKSVVEPGEAVGVVAGQSIGEPSTQMTLNTFHLAGHSAKNVTLGIPRLREIVMTASANISTPSMNLYPHPEIPKEHAETFTKSISRLPLSAVVDKATVTESLGTGTAYQEAKIYKIRLDFYPPEEYCSEYAIKQKDVEDSLELKFIPRLQKLIRVELKKKGLEKAFKSSSRVKSDALPSVGDSARAAANAGADEEEVEQGDPIREGGDEDAESDGDDDDDATGTKQRGRREDSVEFDGPDEEEEAVRAQAVREESPEEDETYGGSPRTSPVPEGSESESDTEDESRPAGSAAARGDRIMHAYTDVSNTKFDKHGKWCEITFEYSASTAKLLMLHLVEDACNFATIQVIPGIANCLLSKEDGPIDPSTGKPTEIPVVVTEGENMVAMRDYQHIIDPNRLFTNDIAAMLRLYGVEACRASIVREMHAVFHGHGISVDRRHLTLVADTMTRGGGFMPFSRLGMKGNMSPFMKMSFETTLGFLRDAVLEQDWDDLRNPSARIVVGKLSGVGTGCFDVMVPVSSGV
ncbi:DNA-directed RNA polymeras-like protein I subunit [Mytilinidion resinicola]|uniref:DNA-directed RNA polymerase subunit n=1 Tax=Mytilinidion resinicola TaxID=574789 RepID=A0A6A6XZJ9_9PEZI|nr:DNA-directed RNA polymeras-like protein I subunit [Mytilinidion resinicola]KAF2801996.1 DNA-directed RNA polymeras-like protein I subunit [Mytilinidion resinicola]